VCKSKRPDLEALHLERELEPDLASVRRRQSAEGGGRAGIEGRARLERSQMDVFAGGGIRRGRAK
jgi:hypothetical protein